MFTRSTLAAALLAISSLGSACTESDPCDSTSVLDGTSCKPRGDEPPAPAVDAAAPAAASSDGGATFGSPCQDSTNHSDCTGDVDYCAKMPGQTRGTCTRKGCDSMPSLCPMGWQCFNVGQFSPGQPHICVRS
jgi:hypothetical protein